MTSRGPAAGEHLGPALPGWGGGRGARPGVFDGWFPFFRISHMQISACGSGCRPCSRVSTYLRTETPRSPVFPFLYLICEDSVNFT